jgi:hypothetical protein
MAKLPAFQFYPGDWMKDPQVSMLSAASRGVWFDLICAMHEAGRLGSLSATTDQFARIARCSTAEFVQALTDFQATGVANVTERNGKVTVVNRRMKREHNEREGNKLRQSRFRSNAKSNAKVTPYSSTSSSSSNKEIKGIDWIWDDEKKKFLNDGKWIYTFCVSKKLKPDQFNTIANDFLTDLELKEDYKPIKEIRNHFTNWFNKGAKTDRKVPDVKTGPSLREIEEAENRKKLGM